MNHQEATELAAVEKYLLDELSPALRDAFEEHFFGCPECSADLRDFTIAGDVFHDFQATGGFRDNIGVEIRLAKFFFPQPRSK
jgi:hypothetical protein